MSNNIDEIDATHSDKLYPVITYEKSEKKVSSSNSKNLEQIKGKTLEVYYYLVNNPGKHGVREIQRKLNYSSSSVAAYHLNRLIDNNLITKTDNSLYFVEGDPVKLGRLEDHIRVAGVLIPKIIIYSYQAIISILVALFFLYLKVDILVWFVFFLISNLVFLSILIRDSLVISKKLQVGN